MLKLIQDGTKERPFIGVATIVVKDGLILIGYDGDKQKFSFPGGFWEQDSQESLAHAAAREIYEETGGNSGVSGAGVKCTDFKEIYNYTFFREDKNVWHKSVGFVANYKSGLPGDDLSEKRTNWSFVQPKEALKLDLFDPAKKGLLIYLKGK